MSAIQINKTNFTEEVIRSDRPVLLDFWAPWCGPCRMLGPVIEDLAGQYEGRALVGKVNTDDAPDLARRFGVMSIPCVIFFKDGQEIDRKVGVMPPASYTEVLDGNL